MLLRHHHRRLLKPPNPSRRGSRFAVALTIACLLLGLLAPRDVHAQASEHALKVAYLYKFTHYIQWPAVANQPFVIGVLGDSPVVVQIEKLAQLKKVGDRPIRVRRLAQANDAANCHMVFLAASTALEVQAAVIQITSRQPILVIGESDGLAKQGAPVNFFLDESDGTLGFAINITALKNRGFRADPKLLKLAEIVQ